MMPMLPGVTYMYMGLAKDGIESAGNRGPRNRDLEPVIATLHRIRQAKALGHQSVGAPEAEALTDPEERFLYLRRGERRVTVPDPRPT